MKCIYCLRIVKCNLNCLAAKMSNKLNNCVCFNCELDQILQIYNSLNFIPPLAFKIFISCYRDQMPSNILNELMKKYIASKL